MAKTGIEYTCAALLKTAADKATATYEKGMYIGPVSTFNVTVNNSDVKDYGDNKAVESERATTDGSLSIEINDLTPAVHAFLLGHTVNATSGDLEVNIDDSAPDLGIGSVKRIKAGGKKYYQGIWCYRVQLGEPNDENSTQQENVAFSHSTLEGSVLPLEDGVGFYDTSKRFETLAEAKSWLNEKAGIA